MTVCDDDDGDVSEQSVTSTVGGRLEVLTGPCVTFTFTADCVTVTSVVSVNTTTATCASLLFIYHNDRTHGTHKMKRIIKTQSSVCVCVQ